MGLLTVFAMADAVCGQGLGAVLSSVQERRLAADWSPAVWEGIPAGASGPVEFPTEADVQTLGIEARLRLLAQAVGAFRSVCDAYVNVRPEDLAAAAGTDAGALDPFTKVGFAPYGPIEPATYRTVLRQLALDVTRLRVLIAPAVDCETVSTTGSDLAEEQWEWVNGQDVRVARDANYDVVSFPGNLPTTVGIGQNGTSGQPESGTPADSVGVSASYSESYDETHPQGTFPPMRRLSWTVTHQQVSALGADEPAYWPGGTAVVVGRVAWSPWTGSPPITNADGAWRVIGSAEPGETVSFDTQASTAQLTGTWADQGTGSKKFVPAGFAFARDGSGNSVGFDWKLGVPGDLTGYRRDYKCLLIPAFAQGLDAPAAKAALAGLRGVTPAAAVDGRVLPRPAPGMVLGVNLGPGTVDGTAEAWLAVVPSYSDYWYGEWTIDPLDLGDGWTPWSWHGWRFDCASSLRFIGPEADYHVVYETGRNSQGGPWPLPSCNFGDSGFRDHGWGDRDAFLEAWDTPRLRQIVGRHLLVDITPLDGYRRTVKIYRRDGSVPDLDPGEVAGTSGLPLLRELTIGNPQVPGTMTGFGAGPEHVRVTDTTAGTTLDASLTSLGFYWGDWEFKLSKTTGGLQMWKEVWASDCEASDVWDLDWLTDQAPAYAVTVTQGSAETVVNGLPGPCHVWPDTPTSLAAGGLTSGWADENPDSGTLKRTTTATGEPATVETWRLLTPTYTYDYGSRPRIPLGVTCGGWKNECVLAAGSNILETRTFLNDARTGTRWTEWTDNGATGDSVTIRSAPDGKVTDMNAGSVAMIRVDFGGLDGAAGTLPWTLRRFDSGNGGGTLVSHSEPVAGRHEIKVDTGHFASPAQTAVDRGTRQSIITNATGYPVSSESDLIWGTNVVPTGTAQWDQTTLTSWGEPTKVTRTPGNLVEQWSYASAEGQTADNLTLRSWTGPLGLALEFNKPDELGRATGGKWNGLTFGVGHMADGTGADLTIGSGETQMIASQRNDLLGRFASATGGAGGRTTSGALQRNADGSSTWNRSDSFAGTDTVNVAASGSLTSATGTTRPFGGSLGEGMLIDDANGWLKSGVSIKDQSGSFLTTWTDAWGRPRKAETPTTAPPPAVNDVTNWIYSNPTAVPQRVCVADAAGRKLITESDPYNAAGMIRRSGIDLGSGPDENRSLANGDRYVESVTTVSGGKMVTVTSLTENAGLREILRTEWNPADGKTTIITNGNEETITRTPHYSSKTVTTVSTKGWTRTDTLNNLGNTDLSSLTGTGIPTASLNPAWRDDGSLAGVSLTIGGETLGATFNRNGTLATLTTPDRGNILGGHSFVTDTDGKRKSVLTVDGTTVKESLDGTMAEISGGNVTGRTDKLEASDGVFKATTTPVGGAATEVVMNAAGAPIDKNYAAGAGEGYVFDPGGLLKSVTLARGGQLDLGYSPDGAKDLVSAVWPTMVSGTGPDAFTIPAVSHSFGHDRAGRVDAIGDASGARSLAYQNGRPSSELWTAGPLKGYEIIRHRDGTGRDTGFTLKRDGAIIHSASKAPNDVSDQISALASGALKVVPQRDGAGRITGFQWGNATGTFTAAVTQTWARGVGGRIEAAGSDVSGALDFDYLIDPDNPDQSFDTRGRRLKCDTADGIWTYAYTNGQLTSATHPTLGTFSYQFDGIGRRKNHVDSENFADLLNRTLDWKNSQTKTLRIRTAAGADVHIENGTVTEDLTNFSGDDTRSVSIPGDSGGWVPWRVLATLQGLGEGAGNPPPNALASPDAKSEQRGAVWVPPIIEEFHYDQAGNRESSALWDYGWDGRNQLVRARTKGYNIAAKGYDLTFDYDAEGRRFRKHVIEYRNGDRVSEKEITFVWDGWNMIYERHQLPSGLTTLERKYLWGEDLGGGSHGDDGAGGAGGLLLIRETKGNVTQDVIPLYDGTGHVVALTNSNKDLLASYAYGPFGELIHATGPLANSNPWRYATKYFDAETGLCFFGKRYYDPITGQWLSRELLGESESLNLYQYTGGDPVNKVDVCGLEERVIANSAPVLFTNPEIADSVFMAFPLEEDGWFGLSPFKPNGKHSFVRMPMPISAARQFLEHPEFIARFRSTAGGQLEVTHANAQIFYISNSIEFVGGVGEMTAGIAAAPESAGVSMVATVHGFDVASTRWQRLWAGPESDIQSGTSQLLQLIPGVDRQKAEIGDNLISLATTGGSMYVLGKAPLAYVPRMVSPVAASETIATSGGSGAFNLLPEAALSKHIRGIHSALSESGATAVFRKGDVSMAQLRTLTRVTGDEYSMFTLRGQRFVIRAYGSRVRVSQSLYDDLVAGKYGRWSGHTHPAGHSLNPGPADQPFLRAMKQRQSGIWGDDGALPFDQGFPWNIGN